MRTIQKLSVMCLAILFAQLAPAQSFTQKGTIELGGDISFSSQKESEADASLTTLSFNPYVGVMVSDGFELGFRPQIMTVSYSGSSLSSLGLYLTPAYNFKTSSKAIPYLEFIIGYNSIDNDGDSYGGLGTGADGGLKINIAGNSLLLIKLEYLHQSYEMDGDSYSINTLSFGFGFRVFLGPKAAMK